MGKWVWMLLCLYALPAMAEDTLAASQASETQAADAIEVLDVPHQYLAEKFVGMVSDIDRFFGDDRNYQEGNRSVMQLDLTWATGYNGNRQLALGGRAKIHLPLAERRLHLLLESDPDKNIGGDTVLPQAITQANLATPSSYAAALRYENTPPSEQWFFSTDAGIKFQGLNSHLFTRARASYSAQSEQWRAKFAETPFWFNNLGVGSSSQLDLEHSISEPVLFRASSNATWLRDKKNFDLRQDLTLYRTLTDGKALYYQASAIGANRPQFHVSDYVFSVLYRYRLHQKWMFVEVSPQMHYPQTRNYQPSPALVFRLEMLFDASPQK